MRRYMIEREIPGAGALSDSELRAIARKSNATLRELGSGIQWVQSYVTDDAITCVYLAESEELIREHARRGGFPATRVSEVRGVIDPMTAEARRTAPAATA